MWSHKRAPPPRVRIPPSDLAPPMWAGPPLHFTAFRRPNASAAALLQRAVSSASSGSFPPRRSLEAEAARDSPSRGRRKSVPAFPNCDRRALPSPAPARAGDGLPAGPRSKGASPTAPHRPTWRRTRTIRSFPELSRAAGWLHKAGADVPPRAPVGLNPGGSPSSSRPCRCHCDTTLPRKLCSGRFCERMAIPNGWPASARTRRGASGGAGHGGTSFSHRRGSPRPAFWRCCSTASWGDASRGRRPLARPIAPR